jgi:hypothetical protein
MLLRKELRLTRPSRKRDERANKRTSCFSWVTGIESD